jgi:alpha-beta hydrolase superfamily lysophospholipase
MNTYPLHKLLQQGLLAIILVTLWITALADPNVKNVKLTTGIKLQYVDNGPPHSQAIIFLHGATDSSHSWSATTPFLSDSFRTFALDQRGHGDSDKPAFGYSISQYAEDVIAFMRLVHK